MPTPRNDETRDEFVNRCIPVVIEEGSAPDVATAQCQSIWDEAMENDKTYQMNKESHLDCCMKISAINEEERSVTAVISSSAVDRDREVLLAKGMDAERFQKNPIVLWAHDSHSPPIGKALWVKTKGQKITAKVQFATSEFAEEIWQMFKGKFLNAFSVGFIPHDGHQPTPKEVTKNPAWAEARFIITEWELLEFSAVPVPANPEALAQAVKSKSLTLSDKTKDLFPEILHEDNFEKHIDCEIEEIEEEIEIKLESLPEIELIPIVKLEPIEDDISSIVLEEIKKQKGVMYG